MKTKLILTLAVGVVIGLCGCATTGYQRASETRLAITQASAIAMNSQQDVDNAVLALQKLTGKEAIDLRPPFETFAAAVGALETQAAGLADRGESIRKRSGIYIDAWQRELDAYRNSEIRARSAERRTEVMEGFRKIDEQFRSADQALRPLLVDLQDMRRYLRTDLTAGGVASVQEQAARIMTQAGNVRQCLQSLQTELDHLNANLVPARPATEPATAVK